MNDQSESQARKRKLNICTIESSSSIEAQEEGTPSREVEQQTPTKKSRVQENLNESLLELIADDIEEKYDTNFEKLLQTDEDKDSTLMKRVTEYNLQTLANREYNKNFVHLFSEALVQIHFDNSKFDTSGILLPETKISLFCKEYLQVMETFLDESVNELCLQCCSIFPIFIALAANLEIPMKMNGGGKYKILELQKTAKSLNLTSVRLHSDLDFYLDKTKIKNQNLHSFPTTFYPYFGIYELSKSSKIVSIEQHCNFVKIIGVLKAIAKSYATTLKMSPFDLQKICVWGVLQSSTMIWFLQCTIETYEVALMQNTFSLLYHITCSDPFHLQEDNEKIIKLYYKIIQSGKDLQTLLGSFKPNYDVQYPVTKISKLLSHQKYKKGTLEESAVTFLEERAHTMRIMSIDENDQFTTKFKVAMYSNFQWNYKGYTELKTIHEIGFYIMKYENTYFYFLIDYVLKEVPLAHKITPILNHYVICRKETTETDDNKQFVVFQFTTSTSEFQNSKANEEVSITNDRDSQKQDGCSEIFSIQNNNQQSNQQNTTNIYKNGILPSNRLEISFQSSTVPFKYDIHCKHETCRGIYCAVTKRGVYGSNFLKVSEGFLHLEAIETMKKLLNHELQHKNLVKVLKYSIVLGPDRAGQIVTATETEVLIHFSDEIPKQFKNRIKFVNWIIEDVFFGALDGLHYLHQNQIIHGDISVNNIMFRSNYSTKETYSVLIDLNDSIPFCNLNRRIILFGTEGYVPKNVQKPSIFTDCYGLIVTICVFIYFALFDETIDVSKNYCKLSSIFTISNWKINCKEEKIFVAQFINNLYKLFESVVIQENIDSLSSAQQLKKYFQSKPLLVSSTDRIDKTTIEE